MIRTILALAFVISMTAEQCDLSNINIDDYVTTYQINVTNDTPMDILVVVRLKDVARNAVLKPGETENVTSFQGGPYTLAAMDAAGYVASLRQLGDPIAAVMKKRAGMTRAEATAIYDGLLKMSVEGRARYQTPQAASCAGDLTRLEGGIGSRTRHNITFTNGVWAC